MRVNYKIIWVEDEPDDMEVVADLINRKIKDNFLIPEGMDKPFTSYESFYEEFLSDFNKNKFLDCDLLLVDFNISNNDHSLYNGRNLIKTIRDKGIFTDVLFYSGNIEGLKKSLLVGERENLQVDLIGLDGVSYSENLRDKLIPKFELLLEKHVETRMGISNIRGYFMDCTSDFDFTYKNLAIGLYKKLPTEKAVKVNNQIIEFIEAQRKYENDKFDNVKKNYGKQKIIKDAMDSMEFVMPTINKVHIFCMILSLMIEEYNEETFVETYTNNYDMQIIKPRNKLAHAKLQYGKVNLSHIKIAKTFEDLNCICNSCNESNYITKNDINKYKKDIYEFYLNLKEILEKATAIVL